MWDTLGQEKFKSIAPIFFRKSAAALLVYDVTDKDSFLALPTWKEQIKNNSQENIVVICVDLIHHLLPRQILFSDAKISLEIMRIMILSQNPRTFAAAAATAGLL